MDQFREVVPLMHSFIYKTQNLTLKYTALKHQAIYSRSTFSFMKSSLNFIPWISSRSCGNQNNPEGLTLYRLHLKHPTSGCNVPKTQFFPLTSSIFYMTVLVSAALCLSTKDAPFAQVILNKFTFPSKSKQKSSFQYL